MRVSLGRKWGAGRRDEEEWRGGEGRTVDLARFFKEGLDALVVGEVGRVDDDVGALVEGEDGLLDLVELALAAAREDELGCAGLGKGEGFCSPASTACARDEDGEAVCSVGEGGGRVDVRVEVVLAAADEGRCALRVAGCAGHAADGGEGREQEMQRLASDGVDGMWRPGPSSTLAREQGAQGLAATGPGLRQSDDALCEKTAGRGRRRSRGIARPAPPPPRSRLPSCSLTSYPSPSCVHPGQHCDTHLARPHATRAASHPLAVQLAHLVPHLLGPLRARPVNQRAPACVHSLSTAYAQPS